MERKISVLLFVGRNNETGYTIDSIIVKSGCKKYLILSGNIDKAEIPSYYEQADVVASLNIAEGFGLSLIKGVHFGLPFMTFINFERSTLRRLLLTSQTEMMQLLQSV